MGEDIFTAQMISYLSVRKENSKNNKPSTLIQIIFILFSVNINYSKPLPQDRIH